jgi:hypothetical protein
MLALHELSEGEEVMLECSWNRPSAFRLHNSLHFGRPLHWLLHCQRYPLSAVQKNFEAHLCNLVKLLA